MFERGRLLKDLVVSCTTLLAVPGLVEIGADADYAGTFTGLPPELENVAEKNFFLSHTRALSLRLTASQRTVRQTDALFVVDAAWTVSSVVRLYDDADDSGDSFERLNTRLQLHEAAVRRALAAKQDVRRHIRLLKLISFLVPLLVAMKKRMRVPDITKLLPNLLGTYGRQAYAKLQPRGAVEVQPPLSRQITKM